MVLLAPIATVGIDADRLPRRSNHLGLAAVCLDRELSVPSKSFQLIRLARRGRVSCCPDHVRKG